MNSALILARELVKETAMVSGTLFRQMIPAIIVVKILEELGMVPWIGWALGPAMNLVGLPSELGLVWATALLTNIYPAMVVYIGMADTLPALTGAQATVLGILLLIAHGLPVEARVARLAGVKVHITILIRVLGALVLGFLLHHFYQATNWLQEPSPPLWQPEPQDPSLLGWGIEQLQSLTMIVLIIFALLVVLRLLKALGIEELLNRALRPVLRRIGIGEQATTVTLIGVSLGLSYGAGLLAREAQAGHIPRRDLFLSMALLGLCHSLIEDTLAVMLIGADLSGIFWARLVFALLAVALLAKLIDWLGPDFQQRHLLAKI